MSEKFDFECTGSERMIPKDLEPVTLYHVTTSLKNVCKRGLKAVDDVWKESKRGGQTFRRGIGGGDSKMLSFTYDPSLAEDYFQDVRTAVGIANGEITPKNIGDYLDKVDGKGMSVKPSELLHDLGDPDSEKVPLKDVNPNRPWSKGEFAKMQEGKIYDPLDICEIAEVDPTYIGGLSSDMAEAVKSICKKRGKFGGTSTDPKYSKYLYRVADSDKIQSKLWEMFKYSYITNRSKLGGRQNPMFFVGIDNFRGVKPEEVGIVKVLAGVPKPPEYKYYNCPKRDDVIDEYLRIATRCGEEPYGQFRPDYSSEVHGKFEFLGVVEKEVRLVPEWTTDLRVVKRGKPIKKK